MRRWLLRRGTARTVFEALLVVQFAHLGEHLVQIAQIHLLGWPAPEARGLVAAFDVETMHFMWNVGVLAAVAWLLRVGVASRALAATFMWAAAHTVEHAYLITRAMLTGLESAPGILGGGGLALNLRRRGARADDLDAADGPSHLERRRGRITGARIHRVRTAMAVAVHSSLADFRTGRRRRGRSGAEPRVGHARGSADHRAGSLRRDRRRAQ